MQMIQRVSHYALISMAAIIMAGCAGQKQPAQKLIGDIQASVTAASRSTPAASFLLVFLLRRSMRF